MALKIYNTLTRQEAVFAPQEPGHVRMYVCGPTVYDDPHIGHVRAAYIFDTIRRYLEFLGYRVTFVRNVTDIDDKIIDRARAEPGDDLGSKVRMLASTYFDRYKTALNAMGIGDPTREPKATEHIGQMIEMIRVLIDKNAAYAAEGSVYFSVRSVSGYGRLSGQSPDLMETGNRPVREAGKRDPLDFALWKKAAPDEPSWESPWGAGRPGWHIECSCMSAAYLGPTFDIHGGGVDLVFPHHENEIAQSEAANGKPFARIWIHNGLVTINGQKMAKSLGNFIPVEGFLRDYDPEVLKLFFLSVHYRNPIDYTQLRIEEAVRARERFYILFKKLFDREEGSQERAALPAPVRAELATHAAAFTGAMDNDFNTALALAALFDMVSFAHRTLDDGSLSAAQVKEFAVIMRSELVRCGAVFGLFSSIGEGVLPCDHLLDAGARTRIEERIRQRDEARRQKDYRRADEIRQQLLAEHVVLEDTRTGTVWRVTR